MAQTDTSSEEDRRVGDLMEAANEATRRGDVKQAEALTAQAMQAVMARTVDNPSPSLALSMEAHLHEDRHEWNEAERCYREILTLAQQEGQQMALFKARADLAGFYSLLERSGEALAEARAAEEAVRGEFAILRLMGLDQLVPYEMNAGNWKRVRELTDEMLKEQDGESGTNELMRARALIHRARWHLNDGSGAAAERDMEAAWRILEPFQAPSGMAGYHSALARWWDAKSRLYSSQEDVEAAAQAYDRSLEQARIVANAKQLPRNVRLGGLATRLERYAAVLRKAGRVEEAARAADEGRELRVIVGIPAKRKEPIQ